MTRVVPKYATAAAVAALLAFGAGGALAQSSMSAPSAGAPSRTAAPPTANAPTTSSTPMKDPLSSEDISQIEGSSVVASDGTSIGKVSTVLMDPSSKKVDRLVVAEGGVLGVGAHKVALPVDTFHWDSEKHSFTIQKMADDLKAMPEWRQPQLAEAPSGSSAPAASSPAAPRESGMNAGTNGSSPAGTASAPVTPSGK
ncbi:MAG TPA: PRC-barrel domain-containing protein [Stellaceae bacterium]